MKKLLVTGLAVAATLGIGIGAAGADTVSVSVNSGTMSASTTDLVLSSMTYSQDVQGVTGEIEVTADDSTGLYDGWTVNLQASDFAGVGPNSEVLPSIDAVNLEVYYAQAPTVVTGQAVNAGGPKVPGFTVFGSLDEETGGKNVMVAAEGSGDGIYNQVLGLQLTVPGGRAIGTYTTELTVTMSAGTP